MNKTIDFLPANALKKAFSNPKAWKDFFKMRADRIAYNNKLAAFTLEYWTKLYKKIIANPKAGNLNVYYGEFKGNFYYYHFLKALEHCAGQYGYLSKLKDDHSNGGVYLTMDISWDKEISEKDMADHALKFAMLQSQQFHVTDIDLKFEVQYHAEKLKVPYEDLIFVSEQPKNAVTLRKLCTKEIEEIRNKQLIELKVSPSEEEEED
jgi:hypothetical protein